MLAKVANKVKDHEACGSLHSDAMRRMTIARQVAAFIGPLHTNLYRASGGRLGGRIGRNEVLLLTVTGRKSGRPRTTPLFYGRDAEDLVLIASNGGSRQPPAWWLNLQANSTAAVEIGRHRQRMRAEEVDGPERERLWRLMAATYPTYDAYQRRTSRIIPVVRLRPVAETGPGP